MTLYAKLEELYTVTFDSEVGSAVEPQTVRYQGTATELGDPAKDDCKFEG